MSNLTGKVIAFRGDEEKVNTNTLIELTDVLDKGVVEIQFAVAKQSVYLKFSLVELLRLAVTEETKS